MLCNFACEKLDLLMLRWVSHTEFPISLEELFLTLSQEFILHYNGRKHEKCSGTHCVHTTNFVLLPGLGRVTQAIKSSSQWRAGCDRPE
jgi:hypothetical protein